MTVGRSREAYGEASKLPLEIRLLVSAGYSRIDRHRFDGRSLGRMDDDCPRRTLFGWHRQLAGASHAPCRLVGQTVRFCPCQELPAADIVDYKR